MKAAEPIHNCLPAPTFSADDKYVEFSARSVKSTIQIRLTF